MTHDERIAADRERVVEAVRERVAAGSAIPGSLTEVRAVLDALDEARAECARLRSSALEQQRHREKAEESAREYRQAWQRDLGKGREHVARAEDAETALSNLRALHLGAQLDEMRAERNAAALAEVRDAVADLREAIRYAREDGALEAWVTRAKVIANAYKRVTRAVAALPADLAAQREARIRADERVKVTLPLRNVLALSRRLHKRGALSDEDAGHFARFCADGGVEPSVLRDADEAERGTR